MLKPGCNLNWKTMGFWLGSSPGATCIQVPIWEAHGFKMNISLPTWLRMKSSSCPNSSSKESCRWNFYLSSFCSAGKNGRQRLGWMNSKSICCSHHIVDMLTGWKIGKALIFSSCISLILHVYAKKSTWVFGSVNCPLLSWSHDLFQWTLNTKSELLGGQHFVNTRMLTHLERKDSLNIIGGTSLVVQWLRGHTLSAGVLGSILGQETKATHAAKKILHAAMHCSQINKYMLKKKLEKAVPVL